MSISTIRRTNCDRDNARPASMLGKLGMLAAAVMAASATTSVQAEEFLNGRAEVNFLALQGYQAIQAKDGAFREEDEHQSASANRLRVNLQLKFKVTEHITADVDIAEEPNDFGNNGDRDFSFHQDFAGIEFDLLGLAGNSQEDANLNLRVGNIGAAPFMFKGFQDGADNQGNALIGNGMIDYATAETGLQLSYSKFNLDGPISGWNVAGHITSSDFGESYQEDRGYNFRLTGSLEFAGGFKAGLAFFQANQGDQLVFDDMGIASLDGVTRTNYRNGDGENYNFSSTGSSDRNTHIGALPGLDQQIIQLNLAYQPNANTSLILMVGESTDDFTYSDGVGNVQPGNISAGGSSAGFVVRGDSSLEYWVIEGQQYLIPEKFYLAARYAESENTSDLISSSDNTAERIQVAAGYWFNDRTLLKAEWVDQDEGVNSGGQTGTGFDGFVTEISVKF